MGVNQMEFRASAKLLEDPNIFIGDTGASSDTTASDLGFRNRKAASASDNIANASRNDLSGKTVGDKSGIFCDKYGNVKNNVVIKDMVYSPNAEFNLFSLTKRLDKGWTLGGDDRSIWISKADKRFF